MLRTKVRENVNLEREKLRKGCVDSLRVGLGEIQQHFENVLISTPEQTKEIALKMKQRRRSTEKDIYKLSYAFLQSYDNINAFMEVPGALKVLVKELTCNKSNVTMAALECLCNLSLGEKHICDKLINEAGFYIVTFVHNEDVNIKRTSLWILANLLCQGGKSVKRLLNAKLLELLWSDYNEENCCIDAAICLYLATQECTKEQLSFVRHNFTLKQPTGIGAEYHLSILFNANVMQASLSESEKLYLLDFVLFNLKQVDLCEFPGKLRTLYAVRILGNMLHLYGTQPNFLETIQSQMDMSSTLNQLFSCRNDSLSLEALCLTRAWIEVLLAKQQPTEQFIASLRIYK